MIGIIPYDSEANAITHIRLRTFGKILNVLSAIDSTNPADGVPASKADLRTNQEHAKDEIENLRTGPVPAASLAPRLRAASISAPPVGTVPVVAMCNNVACGTRGLVGDRGPKSIHFSSLISAVRMSVLS
jgi:hypothetical protein